jgi:hypothetical protein
MKTPLKKWQDKVKGSPEETWRALPRGRVWAIDCVPLKFFTKIK